jgi:predicted phage baseplate assembly protein
VIDGIEASWLRLSYVVKQGQGYTTSPRMTGLGTECVGATVPARQAEQMRNVYLGQSDGMPAQIFLLRDSPVLRQEEPHAIDAVLDGETTEWTEVSDFADSTGADHHFVLNYAKGEIRFGPSVRDREGVERAYGATPRRGAELYLRSYHSGGGIEGNVGEGTIGQMKTSIPYIAAVTNYRPSSGGLDQESVDEAKLRSLSILKRPAAAITREDFERIAVEVDGVGRARTIAPTTDNGLPPGTVRLLLVPELPGGVELTAEDLAPTPALIEVVSARLDDRKTLGTLIQYDAAPFTWVEVDAHIYVRPGSDTAAAEARATARLRQYFHPTSGGTTGRGLNFGAAATVSQIAGILQSLPEVSYVERVRLRSPGSPQESTRLQAAPDGLLVLGRCYVLAEVTEE